MKSILHFLFILIPCFSFSQWAGVDHGTNYDITGLQPYNNKLYACGYFTGAGGLSAPYIACWNDTVWRDVYGGANTTVKVLNTFNGSLIAAGSFSTIGGVSASYIAKWNDTIWSALTAGTTNGGITALTSNAS